MADFDSTDEANSSGGCGGDVFAQLLAYFEDLRPPGNPFKSQLPTMATTERPRMMDLNPEEPRRDPVDPSQDYNLPFLDISSAIKSVAATGAWNFGKMNALHKLFSTPGHEENKSPLFPPVDEDSTEEEPVDPVEDEEPSVSFQSKYIHIFPLYQDYCVQELRDDLQRLNTKTSLSELIAPQYLQGLQSRLSSQQSPLQSSPGSVSASPPDRSPGSVSASPPDRHVIRMAPCTLWQDLDEVKAAGLLGGLTVRQIRLQETMFELIGSEASYLRSLGIAVDHFCASKDLKRTLSQMEHHTLFSNIRHVKATSEKFLMDLEARLGESVFISQLGDIVLDHCPAFRTHYVPYVTNMMYQEALINQLLQQNRGFVASLKQLEGEPLCQRQGLKSFLVLPFQRITRIKLILENILKRTEADSDAVSYLHKAKEAIHEIVSECNDGIKKMKVIEQLVSLELLLDFGKLKAVPLVISGRFLVHEGPLRLLTVESGPNPKTSLTNVHLHLFNDLLILSSKKEQHFLVEDHAKFPAYVHVAPLKTEVLGLPPESFLFHLSRNHTGQPTAMILVAHSRSDKEQWMKVLKCAD
ncbi:rho guanine nucleotide exchange factor 19 isoform X2 [Phyllopteryx taeniolatus]|uniref:rho guanine nucleotide exchange factor 19 isoform X2 n=1 Tax=Phyllopteryx taeniolatus TaxID=161469 RepID=UPI002AD4E255|nr:rho guanine nucleotide exchange factor 19 isoform X2 [Phyllopteryx taeniolatus]